MSKIAKILIASICFIVAGILIFAIALGASGWDFSKMGNNDYQTKEHEITQEFNSLSLNTITADITLIPTTDEKCKVICYENEKICHQGAHEEGLQVQKFSHGQPCIHSVLRGRNRAVLHRYRHAAASPVRYGLYLSLAELCQDR